MAFFQVYDLGADCDQCTLSHSLTAGQIAVSSSINSSSFSSSFSFQNESQLLTNYGYEDELFTKIVTICPLEAHQSNNLNLVSLSSWYLSLANCPWFISSVIRFQIAVTAKGVRIYFSVLKRPLAYPGPSVRNSADGQYLTQVAYKVILLQKFNLHCESFFLEHFEGRCASADTASGPHSFRPWRGPQFHLQRHPSRCLDRLCRWR